MGHIQSNAELAVRDMLRQVASTTLERTGKTILEAEDRMDDGSPIHLKVTLNATEGSAICDFTLVSNFIENLICLVIISLVPNHILFFQWYWARSMG